VKGVGRKGDRGWEKGNRRRGREKGDRRRGIGEGGREKRATGEGKREKGDGRRHTECIYITHSNISSSLSSGDHVCPKLKET
jgi:hypothetical protein